MMSAHPPIPNPRLRKRFRRRSRLPVSTDTTAGERACRSVRVSCRSGTTPGFLSIHQSQWRLLGLRFGFCRAGKGIDALSWHRSSLVRGPRTRPSRAAICRGRTRSGNGVGQLFSAAGREPPGFASRNKIAARRHPPLRFGPAGKPGRVPAGSGPGKGIAVKAAMGAARPATGARHDTRSLTLSLSRRRNRRRAARTFSHRASARRTGPLWPPARPGRSRSAPAARSRSRPCRTRRHR